MLLTKTGIRSAGALGMLLVAAGAAYAGALAPQKASADSRMSASQGQRLLASRSAQFIENKGQWDSRARFLARTNGLDLWFTDKGIRYDNYVSVGGGSHKFRSGVVGMTFAGGRAVVPVASKKSSGHADFLGRNKKIRGAGTYGEILSRGVYPGIDLRSYFDGGKPRYDLIVAPGADAKSVKLAFTGDKGLSIKKGALQIRTTVGGIVNGQPVAFQTIKGKRVPVVANWKLVGNHQATFALGAYDHSQPLVIDPLVYGSYIGGFGGADEVRSVVADDEGGVYLTGSTRSSIFPVADDPFGPNIAGGSDAFIVKLQGDAYNTEYSAYIGGSGDDVGTFLKRDPNGNVWLAGTTESLDFPGFETNGRGLTQFLRADSQSPATLPTGGTFRLFYYNQNNQPVYTAKIPFDAEPDDVRDALLGINLNATVRPVLRDNNGNFILHLSRTGTYRKTIGGVPTDVFQIGGGKYQIDLQAGQFHTLYVDSVYRSTASTILNEGLPPSFHLISKNASGTPVAPAPVNPTETTPLGVGGDTQVSFDFTYSNTQRVHRYGSIPSGGTYAVSFRNTPATPPPTTATTPATPLLNVIDPQFAQNLTTALNALGNRGTWEFSVAGNPAGQVVAGTDFRNPPGGDFLVTITDTANPPSTTPQKALVFDNSKMFPQMAYVINGDANYEPQTDVFVMRFARNGRSLDPISNEAVMFFGSADTDRFASFDIKSTLTNGNVEFILAGSTRGTLLGAQGEAYNGKTFPGRGNNWTGFIARYIWTAPAPNPNADPARGFATVMPGTPDSNPVDPSNDLPYVSSQRDYQVDVRGAVLDADGNAYLSGTVYYTGNLNTNTSTPQFYTGNKDAATNLSYEGQQYGNRLRNSDAFVRKYTRTGNLRFSSLVGGSYIEEAGGLALGLDGFPVLTGSSIAIDKARNIYVTGISGSYDFLRTRGVYGETFTNTANVFVTKISANAATIIYSTNLRETSEGIPTQPTLNGDFQGYFAAIMPAGIAVDDRGYAYVSLNLRANTVSFPGPTPGDPNQPSSSTASAIPLVGAIDPTYDMPAAPEFPTTEGGLSILNSTATNLVFGSYLGGLLDDFLYAPYVDVDGDVWAFGWTDSLRIYTRVSSTGTVTRYSTTAQLPAQLISEFPFKPVPDSQTGTSYALNANYGSFNTNPNAGGLDQNGRPQPVFVPMTYSRDGFVDRFRIDLPSAGELTFDPTTVPGGQGAYTTGTVNLTQQAPASGTRVEITLPEGTEAATLDQTGTTDQATYTLTVPSGQTSAQFKVYTKAVAVNTSVPVRVNVGGTFRERTFQVIPWLQSIALDVSQVGGSTTQLHGVVTLSAKAIATPNNPLGVEVELTSSNTDIAPITKSPIIVPVGQTTVAFDIDTDGVNAKTTVTISATIPNLTLSKNADILPAKLASITLDPISVLAGANSSVFATLDGKAGSNGYIVDLSANDGTVGFNPTFVTIPYHARTSNTAVITTTINTGNSITIKGTPRNGDAFKTAPLNVTKVTVSSFTLDPDTVDSGGTSTATLQLSASAPSGNARVVIYADTPSLVTFYKADGTTPLPSENGTFYVDVPSGSTTATFKVVANYAGGATNTDVLIHAGTASKTLHIRPVAYTLTAPTLSITGRTSGQSLSATLTLVKPGTTTPALATSDVKFTVTLSDPALKFSDGTLSTVVTIAKGSSSAVISLKAYRVSDETSVTLTATLLGDNSGTKKFVTFTVKKVGLLKIVPATTTIKGGASQFPVPVVKIYFDTDSKDDLLPGVGVQFTSSLPSVIDGQPGVTAAQLQSGATLEGGYLVYTARLNVGRVSKSTDIKITANYGGSKATTNVTVVR